MLKTHLESRKGIREPCNTKKPSLCCEQVIDPSTFRIYQTQQLSTLFHKLICKRNLTRYLMECALSKVQNVGKAEIAFSIKLNNHRKNVSNPKSITADLHFWKPGNLFNLCAKFTLIEQLSIIHTTNKDTLKFRLKHHEDFWG